MNTHDGYKKLTLDNTLVLLAGGGHKPLSDFALSGDYVYKTGDTMTGILHMLANLYTDSAGTGSLDLSNSDIYGVNSIKFADLSDSAAEGLQWYRDATHVDSLWVKSGVIYFTPNRTWGTTGTSAVILHTSNTGLYVGGSGNITSNTALTNGNVYLTLRANSSYFKHNIVGATGISVTSDANGKITITGTEYSTTSHTHAFAQITNKITNSKEFNFLDFESALIWFNYRNASDAAATTAISTYHFGSALSDGTYASIKSSGFIKSGSDDTYVLLGGGGHTLLSGLASTHTHPYLPLAGGAMNNLAVITRTGESVSWVQGRQYPLIKTTSYTGYNAILSMKTTDGSWDLGVYTNNKLYFTYITDTDFNNSNDHQTYSIVFPSDSGTIALTKNLPTVYDKTLTLQVAGTTKTTFTSNSSTDKTFNVTLTDLGAAAINHDHDDMYIKIGGNGFIRQHNLGSWTRILLFTINSGALSPSISFRWIPTEVSRGMWAEYNINIRSNDILFYSVYYGTTTKTLKCVGDGTTFGVWVYGTKTSWEPYGLLQIVGMCRINSYDTTLAYLDSEPTDSYSADAVISGIIDKAIAATKWTVSRTFTIGSTGKSVNGSANVSWTLAEIGAAASNHNHDTKYVRDRLGQDLDFNIPDSSPGSGVYYVNTGYTISNAPGSYGLITAFNYSTGHLQFYGGSNNNIKARSYWYTSDSSFAGYPSWVTLVHSGNISNYLSGYLTSQDHYKTSPTAGTAGTSSSTSGNSFDIPYVTVNSDGHITGYGTHTHTISGFLTELDHYKTSPTAGTAGTSSATSGSTLAIPYITVNSNGHITGYGTHTHTVTGFLSSTSMLFEVELTGNIGSGNPSLDVYLGDIVKVYAGDCLESIIDSDGINIYHKTIGSAGTAGTSSATSGSTIAIPYVTVDAYGHITAKGTHTHTVTGFATSNTLYYLTLNGTNKGHTTGTSLGSFYAPTGAGISGQYLKSNGSGAPTWATFDFASSSHTHTLSIATTTDSSSITLAANTKYKLTAGGSTYVFTTPPSQSGTGGDGNTEYYLTLNGSVNGTSGTTNLGSFYAPTSSGTSGQYLKSNGSGSAPTWVTLSYASSSHTHTLSIAETTDSSSITLAANTKYKLTAGGSTYVFTTPPDQVGSGSITDVWVNTTGDTMTGNLTMSNAWIITPSSNSYGIRPSSNNYGVVGSSSYYFYKGYINNMHSNGYHHTTVDSDDYVLLAGGGYKKLADAVSFGKVAWITSSGVMEIGRYLDWHYDNTTSSDYSCRLQVLGNNSNVINLPTGSGTLALLSDIPNPTDYYWANVKVSSSSNAYTSPTFSSATVNGLVWALALRTGNLNVNYNLHLGESVTNNYHLDLEYSYQYNVAAHKAVIHNIYFTTGGAHIGIGLNYSANAAGSIFLFYFTQQHIENASTGYSYWYEPRNVTVTFQETYSTTDDYDPYTSSAGFVPLSTDGTLNGDHRVSSIKLTNAKLVLVFYSGYNWVVRQIV